VTEERRAGSGTEFTDLLRQTMAEQGVSQTQLADRLDLSSPSYVNHVASGRRQPSPQWVDTVSRAMALSDQRRMALHGAAVRSMGWAVADFTLEKDEGGA
jgi:ribosome-binding protein aMBF1 (putative translation factor)